MPTLRCSLASIGAQYGWQRFDVYERAAPRRAWQSFEVACFPYGAYNEKTLQAVEDAGIGLLFTIREGINTTADRLVYRINAGEPYMTADALIATICKFH